jgi:hypothetical protein
MGNGHFAQCRYQDALREFLSARDAFHDLGDLDSVSALNGSLSSLYWQLGEFDAAIDSARLALARARGIDSKARVRLLILLAGCLRKTARRKNPGSCTKREFSKLPDSTIRASFEWLGPSRLGASVKQSACYSGRRAAGSVSNTEAEPSAQPGFFLSKDRSAAARTGRFALGLGVARRFDHRIEIAWWPIPSGVSIMRGAGSACRKAKSNGRTEISESRWTSRATIAC